MAERQKGMGRGLAAILSVAPKDESEELRQLPIDLISANPNQPRSTFDEETLLGLAESIKLRGVLQPVLVRPIVGGRYELIAGERRWRAARLAELDTIPAVIRRHDDAASLEVALIENMAREDLNPVEEARACAALVEELVADARGGRSPRRPQPRRGLEPDPPARPARRRARPDRARRADRGPRPRPAADRGPRRPPQPRPRCRRRRLVGARARSTRARRGRRPRHASAATRTRRAPSRPGGRDRPDRRRARRSARPSTSTSTPPAAATAPSSPSTRSTRRSTSRVVCVCDAAA